MAQEARLNLRMQRELKLLLTDPPPRASFPSLTSSSSLSSIHALIEGPEGTVYAKGLFNLKIQIPERYPFQPPIVTFLTPIYHPNIDNGGRICLDILNLPPKQGAWQPSLNISTVLTSIGLLLSEPNPDDGLMHDASTEYKYNRQAFDHKARSMTQKYATAGANDFGSHDQEIQTLTNAREGLVEVKELNIPKSEVPDHFVNQKGLCGLSRKLSLDSAGRAQRHNGETVSEVPIDHILNKHMEVSKQGMKEFPIECDLNQDEVQQRTMKLSSEIVSPSKVRNGEKKDYMAKTQCSASLETQSIFLNYEDIQALPQAVRDSGKTANPHNFEMRNVSINKSTNKLLLKSTGFSQKHEDLEKLQFKPQLSVQPGQHSTAQVNHPLSCENLCDHKQPNQDEDIYYNKNMKQQEKESPQCEAVIVLDSEDSEDERSLHKRSKLSLARRYVSGKRKA